MKLAISSPAGNPLDPKTWSNAPAHLAAELARSGLEIVPINSSVYGKAGRAVMALQNVLAGHPWNAVSWFASARKRRGAHVARKAREAGAQLVLCCGTLDVPLGHEMPYAIWLDNTWNLLCGSTAAPRWPTPNLAEIDAMETRVLNGAAAVLTFSRHVRDDIVSHYGVPADRVHLVGCGSGAMPPMTGKKDYASGHLLFVAKQVFSMKGGDLLLEAFKLIKAARPQSKLVMIGNDEARVKSAGIEGVEVHGFISREKLVELFHGASFLVQPMLADPWGQVYLEAMAAKAIVIGLDRAALPELTGGGTLGFLVSQADPEQLAKAVLDAWSRPQAELARMAAKAQQNGAAKHGWKQVGERVLRVVAPLLRQEMKA